MLKSLFVVFALLLSTPALAHGGHGPHKKVVKKRVYVQAPLHYNHIPRVVHKRVWVKGYWYMGAWVSGYWILAPRHVHRRYYHPRYRRF